MSNSAGSRMAAPEWGLATLLVLEAAVSSTKQIRRGAYESPAARCVFLTKRRADDLSGRQLYAWRAARSFSRHGGWVRLSPSDFAKSDEQDEQIIFLLI